MRTPGRLWMGSCCWWKKSCTGWNGESTIIHRVLYMSSGCLGFLSHLFTWLHSFYSGCHVEYPGLKVLHMYLLMCLPSIEWKGCDLTLHVWRKKHCCYESQTPPVAGGHPTFRGSKTNVQIVSRLLGLPGSPKRLFVEWSWCRRDRCFNKGL